MPTLDSSHELALFFLQLLDQSVDNDAGDCTIEFADLMMLLAAQFWNQLDDFFELFLEPSYQGADAVDKAVGFLARPSCKLASSALKFDDGDGSMPHQYELPHKATLAECSPPSALFIERKIVEHVFVGEALRALWRRGVIDVEVLRGEFDAHGYDLVIERGKTVRHIQFKTGVRDRPRRVSVAFALAEKPSGCVIWIQVDNGLEMRRLWWLGAEPEKPLPKLGNRLSQGIGRTRDGTRPLREKYRVINGSQFRAIDTLDEILEKLFGPLPTGLGDGGFRNMHRTRRTSLETPAKSRSVLMSVWFIFSTMPPTKV